MSYTYLTDGGRSPHYARHKGPPRGKNAVCPHSPSCFTCPMPDCVAGGRHAYNEILDDELYFDLIGRYAQ